MGKGRPASVKTVLICLANCNRPATVAEQLFIFGENEELLLDKNGNTVKYFEYTDGTCGKEQCQLYMRKLKMVDLHEPINLKLLGTDLHPESNYLSTDDFISAVDSVVKAQKLKVKDAANKFKAKHTPPPDAAATAQLETHLAAIQQQQEELERAETQRAIVKNRMTSLLRGSSGKKRKASRSADGSDADEPASSRRTRSHMSNEEMEQ
jgi:hypothetical protein